MDDFERWQNEPTKPETAGSPTFDFFGIINRRKWLILFGLSIGLTVGYVFFLYTKPMFLSVAQVTVSRRGAEDYLRSNPFQERVLGNQELSTQAITLGSYKTVLKAMLEGKIDEQLPTFIGMDKQKSLETLLKGVSVSQGDSKYEDANVLNIGFRGTHPEDCPRIINVIIAAYTDNLLGSYQSNSELVKSLFIKIRDDSQKELKQIRDEYRRVKAESRFPIDDRNPVVSLSFFENARQAFEQADREYQEYARLYNTVVQREREGADRVVLLNVIVTMMNQFGQWVAPEPEAVAQRDLTIESQILQVQTDIAALEQRFGPNHRDVKALRKRLEMLEAAKAEHEAEFAGPKPSEGVAEAEVKRSFGMQLVQPVLSESTSYDRLYHDGLIGGSYFEDHFVDQEAMRGSGDQQFANYQQADLFVQRLQALQLVLANTQQRRDDLYQQFADAQTKAFEIQQTTTTLQMLAQEMQEQQDRLEVAVNKLREIEVIPDVGYVVNKITEPGFGRQVAPNLALDLILGGLVGTLCGFGIGFLIDRSERSFRSPDEIRKALSVPVIGHIPVFFPKEDHELDPELASEGVNLDRMLCTFTDSDSLAAEAFRAVRTNLYFSTHGESHKVIQVTSPSSDDGKSTLAANLAISLAQSGVRVLLIDADFRRPRVHQLFGIDKEIGLSNLIRGSADIPEAVRTSEVEGLDLLPAGPRPRNPGELLALPRFKDLMQVLREQYDFVIIDSPPVLAVTDPGPIAARADGVLLALQIRRRSRPAAQRAVEILTDLGANILGVVANGVGWKGVYAYRHGGNFGVGSKFYKYSTDFRSPYLLGDSYAYAVNNAAQSNGDGHEDLLHADESAEERTTRL